MNPPTTHIQPTRLVKLTKRPPVPPPAPPPEDDTERVLREMRELNAALARLRQQLRGKG